MKLVFIEPKDKIELLEDGLISKFDRNFSFKKIPKGSLLEVSQVYIRNKGHYPSSITFKVISGPLVTKLVASIKSKKVIYLESYLQYLKEEISILESNNSNFSYAKNNGKVYYASGSEDDWVTFHPVGTLWKSYHIDHLRRDYLRKEKKIRTLKKNSSESKSKTTNKVIRILISDIKKWNVKLKKKEN